MDESAQERNEKLGVRRTLLITNPTPRSWIYERWVLENVKTWPRTYYPTTFTCLPTGI